MAERHAGFSAQVKVAKDGELRRSYRSLTRREREHIEKLASVRIKGNPQPINHLAHELAVFRQQIRIVLVELVARGIEP